MILFAGMLVDAAMKAGMKVPEVNKDDEYDGNAYPHFHLFVCAQIGTSMPSASCHWGNAKVIAEIPENKLWTITAAELQYLGFQAGYPIP